ncbi:PREDICTED: OTU domain-containing protein 6B isoform X2 [Dinoponera quadriceps]|uniref:ubiquitinyl hydrolase 1 n=1 Tax=Dinoponera quadriceps TaxID=609295 RepID=A0A6P3Y4Y9_DINQU|nr:PREDICTED: OTU domain-containing protein 6B isoform X2 [Dinoponera quadriceps]
MADLVLTEDELMQKHKRERKELQAQIQILKKSICKGDKKKKKEVMEEVGRLEESLEKRHTEELNAWRLARVKLDDKEEAELADMSEEISTDNNCLEQPVQRISKAQKRREKKAIAERERNQRIIEQEALNVFGKRNVEMEAIKKILSERGLMVYEIPSDGHCLYNAVAHQLKVNGEAPLSLHDLRMKTADYLRENMNDFLPFLSNPDSEDLLTPEEFEKYCNDVAKTSTWGGAVELQVLSCILKSPIEVIQATGTPYIIGDQYTNGKKVTVTYHRHMYELGAHYNSVTKHVPDEES